MTRIKFYGIVMSVPPSDRTSTQLAQDSYIGENGKANTGNTLANFFLNRKIGVKKGTFGGWIVAKLVGQKVLDLFREELTSKGNVARDICKETIRDTENEGVIEEANIMRTDEPAQVPLHNELSGATQVAFLDQITQATQDARTQKSPIQPRANIESSEENLENSLEDCPIPASQIPYKKQELSDKGKRLKQLHTDAQSAVSQCQQELDLLHQKLMELKNSRTEKNEKRNKLLRDLTASRQTSRTIDVPKRADIQSAIVRVKNEESELTAEMEKVEKSIKQMKSEVSQLEAKEVKAHREYLLKGATDDDFNEALMKAQQMRPERTGKKRK